MTNELAITLDNSKNEKTFVDPEVLSLSSSGRSVSDTIGGKYKDNQIKYKNTDPGIYSITRFRKYRASAYRRWSRRWVWMVRCTWCILSPSN